MNVLAGFYGAGEIVGIDDYKNVNAWVKRCVARPAVEIGLNMSPRG